MAGVFIRNLNVNNVSDLFKSETQRIDIVVLSQRCKMTLPNEM